MCIENYFNNITRWSSPAPFFREETWGLEWPSSLSKLTLQRRGARWDSGPALFSFHSTCLGLKDPSWTLFSLWCCVWNSLGLKCPYPKSYRVLISRPRQKVSPTFLLLHHFICLLSHRQMLCFHHQGICSLGRGTPCLIHLLSPLLSLFFSLLPAPHKCLINVCVVATEWVNIRRTAAGQWGGLKSLFLHGVFPPQLSAKPALHEITYSIPWPSLWNVGC